MSSDKIKSAIQSLELQLIEAIKKSDLVILDQLLHPDLLFIAPDGTVVTKASDLASHRSGAMEVDELIPSFESFNLIDDTAISVMDYKTSGRMLGNPIQGKFRYIRFWKNFDGSYRVIGGSCMSLDE